MLEAVRAIINRNQDKASFFNIVQMHYPSCSLEYKLIELSYTTAEEAFVKKVRDSGEQYFGHLRAVALIIIVYLRIWDHHVICAALLHDIIEDIEEWTFEKLCEVFGEEIATLVWWVSKPKVSEFNGDKMARNRFYHERLHRAPRRALIIKLADRLHNLLTLWETTPDKRARKITETHDFYLVLAEKEIILIHELEKSLEELKNVNGNNKEKGAV